MDWFIIGVLEHTGLSHLEVRELGYLYANFSVIGLELLRKTLKEALRQMPALGSWPVCTEEEPGT